MKSYATLVLVATVFLFPAGCSGEAQPRHAEAPAGNGVSDQPQASPEEQAKIETALGRLAPEDRALAESQQFCAVEPENRLGLMGTPVKVLVNDQPVFLCCKGCKSTALAEPEKTLAKVQQLKKAAEMSDH